MRTIVTHPTKAEELASKGYTTTPLLSRAEIHRLKALFRETEHISGVDKPFYTSIWSDNPEYRSRVDREIKALLTELLDDFLDRCKPVFANLMVKHVGPDTQLQPHQDWSFVDESQFDSLTIWIPLTDVSRENGALSVLPGSHRLTNHVRPRFADSPFKEIIDKIEEDMMLNVPLKAGEALVMNSRCIHSSPPNQTTETRVAVTIVMIPAEAPIVHYVQDSNDRGHAFRSEVTATFFQRFSCFEYPQGYRSGKRIPIKNSPVSIDDLRALSSTAHCG